MRTHPRPPFAKVTLLDPSIMDQDGDPSPNLGDVIIHRAVMRELEPLFGDRIDRISSQRPLDEELCLRANASRVRFVGGTNLLSSSKTKYTWYREEHKWSWLFPKLRPVALLGVGWGVGYPTWKDWRLKVFYHRMLDRRRLHSVRDAFSERMLRNIGLHNVVNTSCPTLWELDGFDPNPTGAAHDCLFTITDYRRVPERDGRLLETLSAAFPGTLYFHPQGAKDIEYLASLPSYDAIRHRIQTLDRDIATLDTFLAERGSKLLYVGTRLHGGVFAMQHGVKALIIGVDHRAREIGADTGLPVVEDVGETVARWVGGGQRFDALRLPVAAIARWREHWRQFAARLRED